MLNIGLIHILDPKIIHDERECDWVHFMIPEARCIDALVIPKRGQFSVKAIVDKNTCLRKAQYGALHFEVYSSVLGMLCKIILFDDPDGKQVERHFHILKVFKGRSEIDIFDVETHILCIWSAHNTVPMQFCCVNICRAETQFSIVRDQVSHCSYTDVIRIIFLGTVVNNWVCKGKEFLLAVCMGCFVMCHYEHSICPFLPCFIITLRHPPEIFPKRGLPYLCSGLIVHQLDIAGDSLLHD
jgi:hypothetical protein